MNQQRQHGNQHGNQRGNQRRKSQQPKRPAAVDIWRESPPLPDLERIALTHDAGALVRSLGDPPIHDGSSVAGYFVAVAERAAKVATALAYSAGVVADDAGEDD